MNTALKFVSMQNEQTKETKKRTRIARMLNNLFVELSFNVTEIFEINAS